MSMWMPMSISISMEGMVDLSGDGKDKDGEHFWDIRDGELR